MDSLLGPQTTPAHNLPARLTSFVGRERERVGVAELLGESRLTTLIGAPGVGKTRLALRVAEEVASGFSGGVWLVELAPLTEPALVPRAVATVLGVREQPDQPLSATLAEALKGRELLLVLDNCEHLVEACAARAEELLRACPGLRILATSREGLRIEGEATYRVPSLSTPDPSPVLSGSDGEARLMKSESVQLFVDRAQAALPTFTLAGRGAAAVATICRRLDGIPLAIELAAARVGGLSPTQIAARLDDSFRLLTGGRRTALPRQQTLRALVDWSHDLLSEPEQMLLRRLSVFAGGWSMEAAERVCAGAGLGEEDVLDLLLHLVEKSLVVTEERDGETRYRLLETIRQYAGEKLREADEEEDVRQRHAEHFLSLAEESAPKIRSSPDQREWLARTEADHDNLRAALVWSHADGGRAEIGLRLSGALVWFWMERNHITEGRTWLERALVAAGKRSTSIRAKALHALGCLARRQGDYVQAVTALEEALTISRGLGDRWTVALALGNLGATSRDRGGDDRSAALFEEALRLFREIGDGWGIAWTLGNLGNLAHLRADHEAAEALYQEGLATSRGLGDVVGVAWSLGNLADVAMARGDPKAAEQLYLERLALFQGLGSLDSIAYALGPLAELARRRGETGRSRALYQEILSQGRKVGHRRRIAGCLEGLALVAATQGELEYAAWLFGASAAAREAIGLRRAPIQPALHPTYDREVATVRSALGEGAFAAAWAHGRAMSPEQAIELALAPPEPASDQTPTPDRPPINDVSSPLSRREHEVATLVARGLSDRQIAESLVISERTVHGHVGSILAKLDFRSRAQIAVWAVHHGLAASPEG